VGPTVFLPQRQFWNPGSINWNPSKPDPSDFGIWTAAYDVSGIRSVTLMIRISPGRKVPAKANKVYAGGIWKGLSMKRVPLTGPLAPTTDPLPDYIADLFQANVTGVTQSLVDYYVQAVDSLGNIRNSPLQHVYVANKVAL